MDQKPIEHIKELIQKKWFTSLVDESLLDVFENKLGSLLGARNSNILVIHNLQKNTKKYGVTFPSVPLFLKDLTEKEERLLTKISFYQVYFDSDDFTKPSMESIIVDNYMVENSFDDSRNVRDSIKKILDQFYSYDDSFIEKTFDVFDGGNRTLIGAICIDQKTKSNSYIVHEYPLYADDPNAVGFERNCDVLKRIGSLYNINETKLSEISEKLRPIFSDKNVRVAYAQFHSNPKKEESIYIDLSSRLAGNEYTEVNKNIADNLYLGGLITESQKNDIKDWHDSVNRLTCGFLVEIDKKCNVSVNAMTSILSTRPEDIIIAPTSLEPTT